MLNQASQQKYAIACHEWKQVAKILHARNIKWEEGQSLVQWEPWSSGYVEKDHKIVLVRHSRSGKLRVTFDQVNRSPRPNRLVANPLNETSTQLEVHSLVF